MEGASPEFEQQEPLSQAEVERLLAQVAVQEKVAAPGPADPAPDPKRKDPVQPFDFRHPVFLSARELRKMRLHHENVIRTLSAKLSVFLRLDFILRLSKLETIPFHKLVGELPNPAHVTLFKLEPLRGVALLEIHPKLGAAMIDRLLGGQAVAPGQPREFSELELALLDQASNLMLTEWIQHWNLAPPPQLAILGHETNARFLQSSARDTILLCLALDARFGDVAESIRLAFPFQTLEPILSKIRRELETPQKEKTPALGNAAWSGRFEEIQIPVSASCAGIELSARALANLKPGDVLQLPPHFLQQIQIQLAGIPKFMGRLGRRRQQWAVEILPANPGSPAA